MELIVLNPGDTITWRTDFRIQCEIETSKTLQKKHGEGPFDVETVEDVPSNSARRKIGRQKVTFTASNGATTEEGSYWFKKNEPQTKPD